MAGSPKGFHPFKVHEPTPVAGWDAVATMWPAWHSYPSRSRGLTPERSPRPVSCETVHLLIDPPLSPRAGRRLSAQYSCRKIEAPLPPPPRLRGGGVAAVAADRRRHVAYPRPRDGRLAGVALHFSNIAITDSSVPGPRQAQGTLSALGPLLTPTVCAMIDWPLWSVRRRSCTPCGGHGHRAAAQAAGELGSETRQGCMAAGSVRESCCAVALCFGAGGGLLGGIGSPSTGSGCACSLPPPYTPALVGKVVRVELSGFEPDFDPIRRVIISASLRDRRTAHPLPDTMLVLSSYVELFQPGTTPVLPDLLHPDQIATPLGGFMQGKAALVNASGQMVYNGGLLGEIFLDNSVYVQVDLQPGAWRANRADGTDQRQLCPQQGPQRARQPPGPDGRATERAGGAGEGGGAVAARGRWADRAPPGDGGHERWGQGILAHPALCPQSNLSGERNDACDHAAHPLLCRWSGAGAAWRDAAMGAVAAQGRGHAQSVATTARPPPPPAGVPDPQQDSSRDEGAAGLPAMPDDASGLGTNRVRGREGVY